MNRKIFFALICATPIQTRLQTQKLPKLKIQISIDILFKISSAVNFFLDNMVEAPAGMWYRAMRARAHNRLYSHTIGSLYCLTQMHYISDLPAVFPGLRSRLLLQHTLYGCE